MDNTMAEKGSGFLPRLQKHQQTYGFHFLIKHKTARNHQGEYGMPSHQRSGIVGGAESKSFVPRKRKRKEQHVVSYQEACTSQANMSIRGRHRVSAV